ncbi:phage tail protein [Nonomuraea sp. SYSU D8015]|uniref:phage tail protein n=1 Tax=Nonomuraea sp. SYSU D8015 TaxID=2593644 RepID=UPI001660DBC0|nr:phage tail protein [Nonomuraea sp. SYSU D8015]
MPTGHLLTSDPLRNFKFKVAFSRGGANGTSGVETPVNAGFMSISGLSVNTDVIPYREGGYSTSPHKLPGQTDFQPVTFSKGLVVGEDGGFMMRWMRTVMAVSSGGDSGLGSAPATQGYDFRVDVEIMVLSHPVMEGDGDVRARFKLYNAWPTTVSFSDLDAGSNQIIVNQMTLVHEGFGFSLAPNSPTGNAAEFSSSG